MIEFTIFTGTYNSENVIDRVFGSIRNQNYINFEWIIIDDCSKDNTLQLLLDFRRDNPDLDISIITHKENRGVAYSRKEALQLAKGRYFVTWDHDDIQLPDQLSQFSEVWRKHDDPDICNIFCKIKDQNNNVLGDKFPTDIYISNYIDMHDDYLLSTETSGMVEHHVCVKTDRYLEVLKYYEQNNALLEGRLPNGADIWGMLAYLGYRTIFVNKVLRTYYINQVDRITMSSGTRKEKSSRIFLNKLLWVNYFNHKKGHNNYYWYLRTHSAVGLYGFLSGRNVKDILSKINGFNSKVIFFCLIPVSLILYNKYK